VIADVLGWILALALIAVWYCGFCAGRWIERRWPKGRS